MTLLFENLVYRWQEWRIARRRRSQSVDLDLVSHFEGLR